jgi:hypothetical protein
MPKVFISYHHNNDQLYKEKMLEINRVHNIFTDGSVDTGEIDDSLSDERIREVIRDDYLRDSTVTILLVGAEAKNRKHIDWELYSSMYDGIRNKKSGILVVYLPSTSCKYCTVSHEGEKTSVHPEIKNWVTITSRKEYEDRYPEMPPRIIDNLLAKDAKISVVSWDKIEKSPDKLSFLVEAVHNDRTSNEYDLSMPMKRADS